MWLRLAIAALGLSGLTSCSGWQNALDPASGDAEHISWLFWLFVAVLGAIWALVMVVLGLALMMRSRRIDDPLTSHPERDQRTAWVIAVLSGATLVTVLILTGISFVGQRRLFGPREEAVTIRVTGHQWWWDVRYEDHDPARTFTTANEIHLPVGKPVNIKLNSSDVIHSFWVPNLMGKLDLIPGRENQLRLTADRAGIYRGQCAEYCGLQHAHMGFMVVIEPQEAFERWRNGQIAPAAQPDDEERKRGQAAFLSQPCVMCHSVRGTTAGGRVAPDLTHIGGRLTLAAGTLPVSRGNLAAWIVDPHGIKPGVNMPMIKLPPDDLNAISAYLEGLK
jgi:cytochrome c oxidase subunit 2